jgi:hypothetical protein
MLIAWQYLDKKAAAVEALKDYNSMQYIIEHSDEDIYEVETRMTSPHSAKITGVPGKHNPKSGEERLAACLDEIDVLKERYSRERSKAFLVFLASGHLLYGYKKSPHRFIP